MKLLHASDLRIGLAFPDAPRKAEQLRNIRLDALKTLIARARHERVSGIILAGNTLADNRVGERELKELISVLKTSPLPLYILPGSCDPYTPDSPYRTRPELFQPPVRILSEPSPLVEQGYTLYPCPVRERPAREDSLRWIPSRIEGDGLRVAVACASLPPDTLPNVDYIAMGGRFAAEKGELAYWSGTVEACGFGHGRGHANLVTLDPGVPLRVQHVLIGRLQWLDWDRPLRDTAKLQEELDGLKDVSNVLLRMTLRGQVTWDQWEQLNALLTSFSTRCFAFVFDNRLSLSAHQEESVRNPLLRSLVGRLGVAASDSSQGGPSQLPDRGEVALRALDRLGRLLAESGLQDLT